MQILNVRLILEMKNAQIERIKQKTEELIEAKNAYNEMVAEVDQELTEKLEKLKEGKIHIPLKLVTKCLAALKKDRDLIPEVVDELKEILAIGQLSGTSYSQNDEEEEQIIDDVDELLTDDDLLKSEGVSLSGDDEVNLDELSLDVDKYLKQYENDEDLSLDSED